LVLLLLYGIVSWVLIKLEFPATPIMLAVWLILPLVWIWSYLSLIWWRGRSTVARWRFSVQTAALIIILATCVYLFFLVAFGIKVESSGI
jgi:hypothetical protein